MDTALCNPFRIDVPMICLRRVAFRGWAASLTLAATANAVGVHGGHASVLASSVAASRIVHFPGRREPAIPLNLAGWRRVSRVVFFLAPFRPFAVLACSPGRAARDRHLNVQSAGKP